MTILNVDTRVENLRIVRLVDEGLLADTYEVFDEELKETFALKVVKRDFVDEMNFSDQFTRECQVISQLENDAVVGLDRFGVTKWKHWLCYEFFEGFEVEGTTVRTLQDYLQKNPKGLLEEEVVFIMGQLLQAVQQAHGIGLLHRNLKPSNVLLRKGEDDDRLEVKIADFGLTRLIGEERFRELWESGLKQVEELDASLNEETNEGDDSDERIMSPATETALFRAPEELAGETGEETGDLYAIAMMAHWSLTGRPLRKVDNELHLSADLNPGWRAWILAGIDMDPDGSFRNAGEALSQLPRPGTSLRYAEMPFEREGHHVEGRSSPYREGKDRSTDGAENNLRETQQKPKIFRPWAIFFAVLAAIGLAFYGVKQLYLTAYHTPDEWYECDRFIDQYNLKFGLFKGGVEWRGEYEGRKRNASGQWHLDDDGNYHLRIRFLKGTATEKKQDTPPLRAIDIMFQKEGTLDKRVLSARYKQWKDILSYDPDKDRFTLVKRIVPGKGDYFPGIDADDRVKLYDKQSFDNDEVDEVPIYFIPAGQDSNSTK